jgi:ATP-dependent helicase HrpB
VRVSTNAFPVDELLPRIRESLAAHPRLVLEAPPGAGKTTRVPPALLDAPWLQGRRIVMLEPRRVAARAAAGFMARQLGEEVGATVGYRIRFERRLSAATRIEVVTEGILTRMLQDDPMLEGTGALLFDEFHERHLSADLGLALALDVQAQVRPELRLVVMSATLDGERLAAFLDAPRITSAGRSHPVDIAHFPARREESLEQQMRRAVSQALEQHDGDVLAFLPGRREIARVHAAMAGRAGERIELLELHGDLPVEQQVRVLQPAPGGVRRVVLATNVAESSVTLPGVRVVIDSGLAREPRFDPNSGFSRLEVVAIAQSSADQRAGRAGRVAPGWAYRLWPASQRLEPQRRPEIAQVDLAGLALELAAWGNDGLRFPDPPPAGALSAARALLRRLGALHEAATTALGRRMLALGTHPRLAAMLLAPADPAGQALAALRAGRVPPDASRGALQAIDAAAAQWRRRLGVAHAPPREAPPHRLGALLAHGWPDRIARQHPADPRRYQLANGRMARLFDDSALYGEPWLVASELRSESRDALVLRAAPVEEAQLRAEFGDRFAEQDVVRWDADRRALAALRETRFDAIVLHTRPAGRVAPEHAARALSDAVAALGLDALPWNEGLRQWRARARCLRAWMPELGLPDLSDEALLAARAAWLEPAFAGKARLDALSEAEFAAALQSRLDWALRERLERFAPPRIAVPSGQQRRIEYGYDKDADAPLPPVLAVRLQELFGLADTPRICDGRVPLTLHLLSPAGRPLQVTRDLRGFWDRTWPEVRKEMKGRYPKHPWPEDPWSASATHRAKPRGS